jgi:hypothetical protein
VCLGVQDGCCVLDISGKSFCSSERSKSANPTALTVKQLLNLTYVCKDGRATVKTFCPEGYQTFCSQVGASGRVHAVVRPFLSLSPLFQTEPVTGKTSPDNGSF